MFHSLASTAVYLMECSESDAEAEDYLRYVVEHSIVKASQCTPMTFLLSVFDITLGMLFLLSLPLLFLYPR
jgi:hypothetical protein